LRTPYHHQLGVVAILDALGASSFGEQEIKAFIDSQETILQSLNEKADSIWGEHLGREMVATFTFNDTIVIALTLDRFPAIRDVARFFILLRKFFTVSMENGILFRGAVSIGKFYSDTDRNLRMGEAVTDAAAWYEKANWSGIHATPRASMIIDRLIEEEQNEDEKKELASVIIDYEVPMKDRSRPRLKASNWPKSYFVQSLSPCAPGQSRRGRFLELLNSHAVPLGTEEKYFNTLAFYDVVVETQQLNETFGTRHP
jgi:hypothetical protein